MRTVTARRAADSRCGRSLAARLAALPGAGDSGSDQPPRPPSPADEPGRADASGPGRRTWTRSSTSGTPRTPTSRSPSASRRSGDDLRDQVPHRGQGRQRAGPGPGRVPDAAVARQQRRGRRHHGEVDAGQGRVRDGHLGPGHPRHRRRLRRPAGQRPDDALLPHRPVQEVRPRRCPKTWDEYAAAARDGAGRRTRSSYLGTFSSQRPRLVRRARASRPAPSGGRSTARRWKVGINDAATKKVADYWGGLVNEGAIDDQPMYTPEWNKALNDGTLLTWPSAVWAPGVLTGNAPDTKGKWAIAPLPQWSAGENEHAASGAARPPRSRANSKHTRPRRQSSRLAEHRPGGARPADQGAASIYPAADRRRRRRRRSTTAPEFFSNQPDF